MKPTRAIYLKAAERAEQYGVTNHQHAWSDKHDGFPERMCMGGHVMAAAGANMADFREQCELLDPMMGTAFHTFSATHNKYEVAAKLREFAATLED